MPEKERIEEVVVTTLPIQEPSLEEWRSRCEKLESPLEKIRLSLSWMKAALEIQGVPCFREFWEIRKRCLPWFKENLSPKWRVLLWKEYSLLSEEARKVKNIFDEKAAFAAEQFVLAIDAIERDLGQLSTLRKEMSSVWTERYPRFLGKRAFSYIESHGEMVLLNALAVREKTLHAELIRTDMRIRIKNELFHRLVTCRQQIISRRAALTEEVSQSFLKEIGTFVSLAFSSKDNKEAELHRIRQDIQALQAFAKKLPLDHTAFKETREKLSVCWGMLKEKEGELKHLFSVQREERQKARAEEEERYRKERERFRVLQEQKALRMESIKALEQRLETLSSCINEISLEEVSHAKSELIKEIEKTALDRLEKQRIDPLVQKINDKIRERKEQFLLSLSGEDATVLKQLSAMLEESRIQRIEIKRDLETYRRALGGSGFDLKKAILYREFVQTARKNLEKLNASIEALEERIANIPKRIQKLDF